MARSKVLLALAFWLHRSGLLGWLSPAQLQAHLEQLHSLRDSEPLTSGAGFYPSGLLPWAGRWLQERLRLRRLYGRFARPGRFYCNILVIGAGSAGLVTAYIAAAVRAKVTLIEKHKMGGDCLNTGCVPSKTLIQSARLAHTLAQAHEYGVNVATAEVDFAAVMDRVQRVIAQIEPHDSAERCTRLGVECIQGQARFLSPGKWKGLRVSKG